MTKEEIVKIMRFCVDGSSCVGCPIEPNTPSSFEPCDNVLREAADLLETQGRETGKPRWISIKDALPEEPGRYLVCKKRIAPEGLGGNSIDITILRFTAEGAFRMPVHFPKWINDEIDESVTHWMPLPALPKGGQEDG